MAKFLTYDDRMEIESMVKDNRSFTDIGAALKRDRTTIMKEVKQYAVEQ